MTPDRFVRAQEVFAAALEVEPDSRPAFLETACAGDAELRQEVDSLLRSHGSAPSAFMKAPAIEILSDPVPVGEPRRVMTPGTRLGPYEILGPIGAGGMGEVYRARDSKLERDVAVKVLPQLARARTRTRWRGSSGRRWRSRRSPIPTSSRSSTSARRTDDLRGHGAARRRDAARQARAGSDFAASRPSTTRSRSPRAWPPRTRAASSIAT